MDWDWDRIIEKNRAALKRIVAMLAGMAGPGGLASPLAGEDGSARQGAAEAQRAQAEAEALAEAGEGVPAPTLPRHLRLAILRLLRPAESAVRRLIIVAARGLVVTLPPTRPRKARPTSLAPVLRGLGIAVVTSGFAAPVAPKPKAARRRAHALPLLDPLKSFRPRRRYVPAHAAPRILGFDPDATCRPLPAPPSPDDLLDATRVRLRLAALGAALDDLPAQARRFARWKAKGAAAAGAQDEKPQAGRTRRAWPLRPGRAPGQLKTERRRQEVHEVLANLHWFVFEVLEKPDTS